MKRTNVVRFRRFRGEMAEFVLDIARIIVKFNHSVQTEYRRDGGERGN
jgi:hypothetical protein